MPCGSFHQGQAGQSFSFQVTGGPKKVEGFLTSVNAGAATMGTTVVFTDSQLRAGQTVPIVAGFAYHLTLRRSPHAGTTKVRFTAPNGNVTNCSNEGPVIGTWVVFSA
jgi:hypothetical protein